jgi:hypothetical protein
VGFCQWFFWIIRDGKEEDWKVSDMIPLKRYVGRHLSIDKTVKIFLCQVNVYISYKGVS